MLNNCSSTNNFMVKGTEDYLKATDKIIGDWGVTEYVVNGKNLLKGKYKRMIANFDFPTRTAKFTLWVTESTISDKLMDWKREFPDIKVDEYKITYTANWEIADDLYLYLNDPVTDIAITGDGDNFESFYNWEKSKFNMAKSVDNGSLLGAALGSLAQSATGTIDLFPEFSYSYKYSIPESRGNIFTLINGENQIVFKK